MYITSSSTPTSVDLPHLAFPVSHAGDAKVTVQPHSRHWVTRLPAADSIPGQPTWIPVHKREVNPLIIGRPAFESLIPTPPNAEKLKLQEDRFLKGTLQKDPEGLAWYTQEVAQRQQMEKQGQVYTLPVLRPTLENMRTFIAHLLADDHFDEPLNDAERRVLQTVDAEAQTLLDLNIPYKRTVVLSCLFATLYDLLAQQRVLEPLAKRKGKSALRRERGSPVLFPFRFVSRRADGVAQDKGLPVASIDLEYVLSCRWQGLHPQGPDESHYLFAREYSMREDIREYLDNQSVLLYPSWEPLEVKDFCGFGPLPVYPLALVTDYAMNADGSMHSPLNFMVHDIDHICDVLSFRHLNDSGPLGKPENRGAFRQLMLGRLPESLAGPLQLEKAMQLLVFILLHETRVETATSTLEDKSFVCLMRSLAKVRREQWCDHSRDYQGITDAQGTIAALWMHRLFWQQKSSGTRLTPAQLDAFTRHFMATDLVQVQWHLKYIDKHWDALRELFLSEAREETLPCAAGTESNRYFVCTKTACPDLPYTILFKWREPHGGCCVDYSDVMYFDYLHQDGGPEKMEQATGRPIVYRTPF